MSNFESFRLKNGRQGYFIQKNVGQQDGLDQHIAMVQRDVGESNDMVRCFVTVEDLETNPHRGY